MMFVTLLLASQAAFARAEPALPIGERYCHQVTDIGSEATPGWRCEGEPAGYEQGRLWLAAKPASGEVGVEGATLLVHQSRFDRLIVIFGYADGVTLRHEVRAGDYGDYWRVGGQTAFNAPHRRAELTSVRLGLDRLADHGLLRTRLLPAGAAARDAALAASLIGGALTLLALSSAYNLLLARASRQRFVVWHAAWVGSVLIWGLLWSQLALIAFPGLGGTTASRLCTLLSTLAIAFAATCAATCPEPGTAPRWSQRLVLALGWGVALVGVPVAFGPPAVIDILGPPLGMLVLAVLGAVTLLIALAWRRGSREARSFFLAWAIPMLVLGATELVDMGTALFGGGPQIAVLFASALQTVWLSVATTLRLTRLRVERDTAQAAQAELRDLAERDPLTGLLNRRGFVDRTEAVIGGDVPNGAAFGLLLIDIDHFKAINDRYGHDAGDRVLRCLADRLADLTGPGVHAARLGGEEFAIGVTGLELPALVKFAEVVRAAVSDLSLASLVGEERRLSVSIGVAEAIGRSSFRSIYRLADQALYAAKNAGRDRVICAHLGRMDKVDRRMRAA